MTRRNLKAKRHSVNVVDLAAYRHRRARTCSIDPADAFIPAISMTEFEQGEAREEMDRESIAVARRTTMLLLTRSSEELLRDGDLDSVRAAAEVVDDYASHLQARLSLASTAQERLSVVAARMPCRREGGIAAPNAAKRPDWSSILAGMVATVRELSATRPQVLG
jgi:hypothetical protein